MECPKCKIELSKKSIQGIEVEECESCEGIWCNSIELKQVKDKTDSDLNWMDFDIWKHRDRFRTRQAKINCPECREPMHVLDYDKTKVEIDFCEQCKGIWLDKNELENIITALEEEVLTKSTSDYVKATLAEAKELVTGQESFLSEWKDFSTILRFLQYRILSRHPKIHNTMVVFQKNPFNN